MFNLYDYTIRFLQIPIIGTWTYRITTPDQRVLRPFGQFVGRGAAEVAALRHMEMDQAEGEVFDGVELKRKVQGDD